VSVRVRVGVGVCVCVCLCVCMCAICMICWGEFIYLFLGMNAEYHTYQ